MRARRSRQKYCKDVAIVERYRKALQCGKTDGKGCGQAGIYKAEDSTAQDANPHKHGDVELVAEAAWETSVGQSAGFADDSPHVPIDPETCYPWREVLGRVMFRGARAELTTDAFPRSPQAWIKRVSETSVREGCSTILAVRSFEEMVTATVHASGWQPVA